MERNSVIKWKAILLALFSIVSLVSCDDEEDNITSFDNAAWEIGGANLNFPSEDLDFLLDRDNKNDVLRFEWEKPESDRDFVTTYNWMLDTEAGDFSEPILKKVSESNGGKTYVDIPYVAIDEALASSGIEAGATAKLKWAIESTSINKKSLASRSITFKRFDVSPPPSQLFITGSASEAGSNRASALALNRLKRGDGTATSTFQLYTRLETGKTYNFLSSKENDALVYTLQGGKLVEGSDGISVNETAVYRVTVDFAQETYEVFKIDKWSIVGNVIPNGWGGDEPLTYIGNGIWKRSIELIDADSGDANKRFVFRANEDWNVVLKRIQGTENELAFEGTKDDFGIAIEDIPVPEIAKYILELQLNGDGYSYSLVPDTGSATPTTEELFISGSATEAGDVISEALLMNRLKNSDGSLTNIYEIYTGLEAGKTYNFYSTNDGLGVRYTLVNESVEVGSTPIEANETGVYRIKINLTTKSFDIMKIDRMSIVGNVIPNAWSGDEPLEYQGNGVWRRTIELIDADSGDASKRFVFRANEDWNVVLKRIQGTTDQLAFEGTKDDFGLEIEDVPVDGLGSRTITITLNGEGYSYTIQ